MERKKKVERGGKSDKSEWWPSVPKLVGLVERSRFHPMSEAQASLFPWSGKGPAGIRGYWSRRCTCVHSASSPGHSGLTSSNPAIFSGTKPIYTGPFLSLATSLPSSPLSLIPSHLLHMHVFCLPFPPSSSTDELAELHKHQGFRLPRPHRWRRKSIQECSRQWPDQQDQADVWFQQPCWRGTGKNKDGQHPGGQIRSREHIFVIKMPK